MRPKRVEPGPGQESVWDYPRPPRLEPTSARVLVASGDVIVADTNRALRLLETSQPPAYYIPPGDVNHEALTTSRRRSFCEWKGEASYVDLSADGGDVSSRIDHVGWTYKQPTASYAQLAGYHAFYAQLVECSVDGEVVVPNEGSFYGGWVTSNIVGPFKGGPGTSFW